MQGRYASGTGTSFLILAKTRDLRAVLAFGPDNPTHHTQHPRVLGDPGIAPLVFRMTVSLGVTMMCNAQ